MKNPAIEKNHTADNTIVMDDIITGNLSDKQIDDCGKQNNRKYFASKITESEKNAAKQNLFFKTGFEIEFYLQGDNPKQPDILAELLLFTKLHNIPLFKLDKEEGKCKASNIQQYEIAVKESDSTLQTAKNFTLLYQKILEYGFFNCFLTAKNQSSIANSAISAMDFVADSISLPPCGAHFHISLHSKIDGSNLYMKNQNGKATNTGKISSLGGIASKSFIGNIDKYGGVQESESLLFSVAGIIENAVKFFPLFVVNDACKARLKLQAKHGGCIQHPTNISWGGDNRTTMIRIPTSTLFPENRHIEHRLATADCCPYQCLHAILQSILDGLAKQQPPILEKIYGNANQKQYAIMPYSMPFPLES